MPARRQTSPLTRKSLVPAVRTLATRDPDLAAIVKRFGLPPLWDREPGFSTLLHMILEQQVSLASARAAHDRLLARVQPLTPAGFLELGDEELKAVGFSRQKTRYGRELARALGEGTLDLEALGGLEDDPAVAALTRVTGIGRWTAEVYLIMALGRPDVWPVGDLALAESARTVKGLPHRPGPGELEALGEAWRPWRSVAARLLWLDYLGRRGKI